MGYIQCVGGSVSEIGIERAKKMLIETISFEIHNFKTGESEKFLIEDTELNYASVMRQRFTRNIKFVKVFDFQFAKDERKPRFIEVTEVVENALFIENARIADEMASIDPIDEMVGSF